MECSRENLLKAVRQGAAILAAAAAVSLAVNQIRPAGLPLIGDWSPKAQLSTLKTAEDPVISLEEARALFLTRGAVFIDARSRENYLAGHIQGALNAPGDELEESLSRLMSELAPDSLIITYCDGETCTLSKDLAFELSGRGYAHVRVLVNGWSAWLDANLPVETDSQ